MPRGFGAAGLDQSRCPCGRGASYGDCCGRLHQGKAKAQTAEQLMRSRYSAYVMGEVEYLLTTHPDLRVPMVQRRRALRRSCRQTRWLGLTILEVTGGGLQDCEGTVCFEAQFSAGGRKGTLRETSLFQRGCHGQAGDGQEGDGQEGDWLYIRALEH